MKFEGEYNDEIGAVERVSTVVPRSREFTTMVDAGEARLEIDRINSPDAKYLLSTQQSL